LVSTFHTCSPLAASQTWSSSQMTAWMFLPSSVDPVRVAAAATRTSFAPGRLGTRISASNVSVMCRSVGESSHMDLAAPKTRSACSSEPAAQTTRAAASPSPISRYRASAAASSVFPFFFAMLMYAHRIRRRPAASTVKSASTRRRCQGCSTKGRPIHSAVVKTQLASIQRMTSKPRLRRLLPAGGLELGEVRVDGLRRAGAVATVWLPRAAVELVRRQPRLAHRDPQPAAGQRRQAQLRLELGDVALQLVDASTGGVDDHLALRALGEGAGRGLAHHPLPGVVVAEEAVDGAPVGLDDGAGH